MKRTLKIMLALVMAFGMFACGEKKITEKELQELEATVLNPEAPINAEAVPEVVEKFCKFVEQNPEDVNAPDWLFKALDLSVNFLEPEKSLAIGNQFIESYPDNDRTPMVMFVLGSMVYEEKLQDYDKAREIYETILAKYPDSDFVPSVEAALRFLGKTPEEIVKEFEMQQQQDSVAGN